MCGWLIDRSVGFMLERTVCRYATLDIQPTTMTWKYHSARDGVVRDRFTITKTPR
jgi:hypothetical protein